MAQTLLFPDPKPLVERLGRDFFLTAPSCPGVYLMRDAQGAAVYIGKARNLRQRLAAYRVADSPINIVTPIMAYFPLIVVFAARYDKRSGIGTVIALMLPYFAALTVVWTLFFVIWYLLGIPLGPGAPV